MALVGQNGSGKTTLAKHFNGLLHPTSGSILYKGQSLSGKYLQQARLEIGFLFQDPDDQLFGHTVLEDAAFGPRNQGLTRAEAESAARQALEIVRLEHLAYKSPHNLSFGQKKRAALAGLLAMQPQVLILDEPTANLDSFQEAVFLKLLHDFSGTLICISHNLIFLYECCSRALALEHGRLRHDVSFSNLVTDRRRMRAYGLDFSFRFQPEAPRPERDLAATGNHSGALSSGPFPKPQSCLIELTDYSFHYADGSQAIRKVNLKMEEGERLALIGENGAGKSTLLSVLLGLKRGSGEYRFDNRAVTARNSRKLWRQVGIVFQDSADQLFSASVREEIAFGLRRLGLSRQLRDERMERVLDQVGLQGFEERVPVHLSGGERKRLALACVLAMQPRLLILDEPTAGLDPEGEEQILAILRDLRGSLILATHDLFFVRELTERTLVMHQGGILKDLSSRDFLQDKGLGSLNGLAYSYRLQAGEAIQALQQAHEHALPHLHLHDHQHWHGDVQHSHPHLHEHIHGFIHSHHQDQEEHGHPPRRVQEHVHRKHELEDHVHGHGPEEQK